MPKRTSPNDDAPTRRHHNGVPHHCAPTHRWPTDDGCTSAGHAARPDNATGTHESACVSGGEQADTARQSEREQKLLHVGLLVRRPTLLPIALNTEPMPGDDPAGM